MNYLHIIIIIIIVVLFAVLFIYIKKNIQSPEKKLRTKIKKVLKMEDKKAEMVIDDYIIRLEDKNPGKSNTWYLEKMLYDFERLH